MIEISELLVVIIFLTISLYTLFYFYSHGIRPAIIHFLVIYIPWQNLILPTLILTFGISQVIGISLISFKDVLILCALILSIKSIRTIKFKIVDLLGVIFILYLIFNSISSPSDMSSTVYGFRAYSIPIVLFFYGRYTSFTDSQLKFFVRLLLGIGLIVSIYGLVEYIFILLGYSSLIKLFEGFLQSYYGHGSPAATETSVGFLGMTKLVGPFGNNLITSAFLRLIICVLIFYLSYFRKIIKAKHIIFGSVLAISSILTLSRFGLFALLIIALLLLIQREYFSGIQKSFVIILLILSIFLTWNILNMVIKTTFEVEDESTYTHLESIAELEKISTNIFGNGLGTGIHSKAARKEYKTSGGEGLLRQAIPEIGIFGVSLFMLFTVFSIYALSSVNRRFTFRLTNLSPQFWIALPLIFEFLRIPIDIAIRSFLATGLTWFLAGLFISRKTIIYNSKKVI